MRPLMYTCGIALLSAALSASVSAQNVPTSGTDTTPQERANYGATRAEQNTPPQNQVQSELEGGTSAQGRAVGQPLETNANINSPTDQRNPDNQFNNRTNTSVRTNANLQDGNINAQGDVRNGTQFNQTQRQQDRNFDQNNDAQSDSSLGIMLDDNSDQLIVSDIQQDSAAARMGLRQGDRIVRFNNRDFNDRRAFEEAMMNVPRDSQATIVYERGGQRYTRNAWLGQPNQTFGQNSRVMMDQPNYTYDSQTTLKPVGDNLVPMTAGGTGYVMQSGCGCSAAPAPVYSEPAYQSGYQQQSGCYESGYQQSGYSHHSGHGYDACCDDGHGRHGRRGLRRNRW